MKQVSIAKISPPNTTGIIPRKRLFRLMDTGRKQPIVWVAGPAGSGKTSLVASYLNIRRLKCLWYQTDDGDADIASFFYYMSIAAKKAAPRIRKPLPLFTPEYLMGISAFTKRYFENLFSRLIPSSSSSKKTKKRREGNFQFTVVFDNYQDVPAESGFHEVIREALSSIPAGIRIIVLSRSEPPSALARIRMNGEMSLIGWEDIRFSPDEIKALFNAETTRALSADIVRRIHGITEGWVAGLMFLLKKLKSEDTLPEFPDSIGQEELFEYFAGEVFERADAQTRDFLLKTAVLPKITVSVAENLTGAPNAGAILGGLCRNNFFTARLAVKEAIYQYHPLFREFLLSRAALSCSSEELKSVRKQAAGLLEQSGQAEDAAELYRAAGDWASLSILAMKQAQRLVIEGRYQTLDAWIRSFPEEVLNQSPWLLFWRGICRLPFNPTEGRGSLEKAFGLFRRENDAAGAFLSCSGIMDSYFNEWNDLTPVSFWISEFEALVRQYGKFPSPEIEARATFSMCVAMTVHRPDHPDLPVWEERALKFVRLCPDKTQRLLITSFLVMYYMWSGRYKGLSALMDEIRQIMRAPDIAPVAKVTAYAIEAIYGWNTGSFDSCKKAIEAGLELSRSTGIHIWDDTLYAPAVYSATIQGDCVASSEALRAMAPLVNFTRRTATNHYHLLASYDARCRDDVAGSVDHARRAVHAATGAGIPFGTGLAVFSLAHGLFDSNDIEGALSHIEEAYGIGKKIKSFLLQFHCFLLEALIAFSGEGNDSAKRGLMNLRDGLVIGRENEIMNICGWRRSHVAELCARALEAGIETEYVQRLIRTHHLTPGDDFLPGPAWPWPVRIMTLGRFAVIKDDEPVSFARKVQQKPLMLLKALIAHGGREAPEETLSDLLWPESEGDAAHSAFSTTLQRLRALLDNDKALLLSQKQLSIDLRICWVDAWAFEWMHEQADALWRSVNEEGRFQPESIAAEAGRLSEKALALYRGQFLPSDAGEEWTAKYRERLRNKFLRLVLQQGAYLEKTDQWPKAEELFAWALENDELAEEFYQHLMLCFQKQGRKADAIRVYNNCRTVLSSVLGITPSAKTEAMYAAIRK